MNLLPEYSPWEPTRPKCAINLPDYARLPFDPTFWTWRIPDSDVQAAIEAEAARRQEVEERTRQQQERRDAREREDREFRRGIAALGRGELRISPAKPRGPSGPKVDTLVAMAAGYALRLRDEAADAGVDIPGYRAAIREAIAAMDVEDHSVGVEAAKKHLEAFWNRYR